MVFSNGTILLVCILVIFAWLGVLSGLVIRTVSHYNRLTKGITKVGLTEALGAILRTLHVVRGKTETLERLTKALEEDSGLHIQKVGIVRFNPFADTGGAQSFVIALLDKKNNGLVMTSLYARTGNRWYIKEVVAGKGKALALSKEEEAAIDNATHVGRGTS